MQTHSHRPRYYLSRRLRILLAVSLVWLKVCASYAEDVLPVLKANSPNIKIIDSSNAFRGDWLLDPSIELDVYNAVRSDKNKTITFKSDIDSMSFEVEPSHVYDFVILLNGKDVCKTRISTMVQGFERMDNKGTTAPVTIPIAIERGKLILKGYVNGSKTLNLIFDTGAEVCLIYPSAMSKGVKLKLDGTVLNAGSGGVTLRQMSRDNRLEIEDARWIHEPFIYAEKQADSADGIVGYTVFENRIVEIDYDRMLLLVHDSLPSHSGEFSKTAMLFSGALPAVEVVMTQGDNTCRGPFILDTAGSGSMLVNQAFANDHRMHSTLRKVGTSVSRGLGSRSILNNQLMLPTLSIAGHALSNVPLNVELPSDWNQAPPGGVVCMEVLKRFNTILDFPANQAYFKPNERFTEPFKVRGSGPSFQFMFTIAAIALLATTAVWYLAKRKQKRSLNRA